MILRHPPLEMVKELPAQPLGVEPVAFRLASCTAVRLHGDGRFPQPVLGNVFQGGRLPPAKEDNAVHVSHDGFRVVFVEGLALAHCLVKEGQADFP